MPGISDEVRAATERIAVRARLVQIDEAQLTTIVPGPAPGLDPELHFLEGTPEQVATYVCCMDAVNFGSGWWPTIAKRKGLSGAMTMTSALTDQFREREPWTPAHLRQITNAEVAETFGQPVEYELMSLYAQGLRELGMWLGLGGPLRRIEDARGSGQRLARSAVDNMPLFEDRGLYKRAQILVHDLALAGVADWEDLDRLTIFADNLVPHVLRVEGILVYDERLAARIDAEELLTEGGGEREIRGCAVHACELLSARTGVPARLIDGWLWNRGQEPRFKAVPRHRCRTTAY